MQREIPCVLMRGGTSKGAFFNAEDLPADPFLRDQVLLRVMGSPDPAQIDGIGGAATVTSKVAIISPSQDSWAQIDYLFAQVEIEGPVVDTGPSCGNLLAAVAPYALEQGLVSAETDWTRVRVRSINTGTLTEAVVHTPSGRVNYEGETVISGVPGSGSRIELSLRDTVGSKTGRLLPTGRRRDLIEGVEVSCVDVAVPMVFVPAHELGKTGTESKAELDADPAFLDHLETLRRAAAHLMGMGDTRDSVIPKIALVAEPKEGGQVAARYFTPRTAHPSFAVLGSVCLAAAAVLPSTVVHDVATPADDGTVVVEHPSGTIEAGVRLAALDGEPRVDAKVVRTARRLFAGSVCLPGGLWPTNEV